MSKKVIKCRILIGQEIWINESTPLDALIKARDKGLISDMDNIIEVQRIIFE